MKKLVVVTDCDFEDVDIERKILERVNAELRSYNCEDENDVIEIVDEADAVINQYAPITRRVIECLSDSCVAIGQYGIGVDTIDVAAATEKGIVVVNVPSYCEDEVAEHALALLLTLARKLPSYDLEVRRLGWDWKTQAPIHRLSNRTLGLIGFGRIARRLAAKTQGLSLELVAFDPYVKEAVMASMGVRKVDLETLLRSSDLVSVHVPLTEETQNLLSDREFRLMKRDAIIVNVSRGPVIDQDALYEALCQRRLGAAGLDVLYEEPPRAEHSGKGLLDIENVCLTPHVAWYSEESVVELRKKLAGDIARVLQGKDPEGFVNPEVRLHPL
jgi:D-3-phosphoglycerate dehydrogenase